MANESGGWSGPAWGDVWVSARDIEQQLRCVVVFRMGTSKVYKRGGIVELFLTRSMGRNRYGTLAHVQGQFPSKQYSTMPALMIALLYQALEQGIAFDRRPYAQQRLEELPLPPPPEE